MNPNPPLPHRRDLRLPEFDFSQPGAYFVTIVTQNRKPLFGHIVNGEMVLNEAGRMVQEVIDQIPGHYPEIIVEASVIMPNHIHLLLLITDEGAVSNPCQPSNGQVQEVTSTKEQLSLPEIIHRIKSFTTHQYLIGVGDKAWSRFEKRLWQRNYYEHVIRNERDHQATYDYILSNPMNWEKDEENSPS